MALTNVASGDYHAIAATIYIRLSMLFRYPEIHAHAYAMFPSPLVLTSRLLARLELVQVPSADGQAALVVVHALAEGVDVVRARASR
jgi:hypothetical protein